MFTLTLLAKTVTRGGLAENRTRRALRQSYPVRSSRRQRIPLGSPRLAAFRFHNGPPVSTGKKGTTDPACAKILAGRPAKESKHPTLIQAKGFDCKMYEQSLKRWGCRFDRSGNEVCGTHASWDACSNSSKFASFYCTKLGLEWCDCQQSMVYQMVNESLLSRRTIA